MLYWMFCVSLFSDSITSFSDIEGVLVSYQNGLLHRSLCWINFGAIVAKLPVTVTENFMLIRDFRQKN
jgi:hypothetical protein